MKKIIYFLSVLSVSAIIFSSCKPTTPEPDPFPSAEIEGCYVVNYGSFGKGGASISKYDYNDDKMINFFYKSKNGGTELLSNIQYVYHYKDSVFMMGNTADQVITVNPFFEQSLNGVTDKIEKPRYCVADGNFLYISCWGANPDWSKMSDTYIAKYNITTRTVDEKIALPGGPEGLEIANGKLYAALNYKDSVAVINLSSEAVSYIITPAVTSYFVKDKSDNLYVTLLSTYSNPSTETGIGYINTSTDKLDASYNLAGVSSGYGSMIQANAGFSKIYVVTSAYDANWNLTGAVNVFDVAGKKFDTTPFVKDISGISGIAVNPKNSDVYVFASQSTTGVGLMKIYSQTADFVKDIEVGASPNGALFLD